jgi:hypothetical protein
MTWDGAEGLADKRDKGTEGTEGTKGTEVPKDRSFDAVL